MVSQREHEMHGPGDAGRARGMAFGCPACRRPKECPGLPTVAEDGHRRLLDSEVLEVYNARRYRHYVEHFDDADDLREHLVSRAHYWALEDPKSLTDHLASIDATIDATIAWWHIAHRRHVESQDHRQEQLPA